MKIGGGGWKKMVRFFCCSVYIAKAKTSIQFLVSDPRIGIFNFLFLAMKRCPIAPKVARSMGILPCCAFKRPFHIGV